VTAVRAHDTVPGAGSRFDEGGDVRRFWPALLAITAAGALIRVLYTLLEAPWPPDGLDDQFYFSALPRLLADGEGFVNPFLFVLQGGVTLPTAEHPPLHSVVLAGLAELGGTSADLQRLTGTVFGAGTIVLVGLLGRWLVSGRVGLIAAALGAVYPVLVATDGALMSESLYVVLVATSLLLALRLTRAPTVRGGAVLGAVVALAALTRSEGLALLALLLVPLLGSPAGRRAALASVAAAVVVLAPWTVRNWSVFDQPVAISTNSGSAIGGANCEPTFYGDQLGGWQPACLPDRGRGNEAEHMAQLRRDGVDYARDHAGRLPVVLAVRVGRVWNVYDPLQVPEGRSVRVEKLGVAMYALLVPFAVGGAVLLRRRRAELWILLAPVLLVTVTALVTYGNQRFRAPAEVSLVVLAAIGAEALRRAVAARSRAPGGPPS
jgi:4-amino-4-deoxy-L-arabinose transferase-like glycosyltransferase